MVTRIEEAAELYQLILVEQREQQAVIQHILRESRPLLRGHFALQGGHHSRYFLRFTQIGRNVEQVDSLAQMLVNYPQHSPFDVILSPESAGFFLGSAVSRLLNLPLAVAEIDSLRCPRKALRRGQILKGQRVLIVNDVITTGKSLKPLVELAREAGARVIGASSFACTDPKLARKFRYEVDLDVRWLTTCAWNTVHPSLCEACRDHEALLPAAEFN